jgi:hypothetical protein
MLWGRNVLKKIIVLLLSTLALTAGPSAASGFYQVAWKDGKAWLAAPGGKPFLSMGVNAIGDQSYRAPNDNYYNPVKNQYKGDKKAWMDGVFKRLKKWRFNTVGCWADEDLLAKKFPYTYMLYIGRGNPWERVLDSVFAEDFESVVKNNAQKVARFKDDADLVGYFLDNELPWWGEFGWKADGQKSLLEKYAANVVPGPDKEKLKEFFRTRYNDDPESFNKIWEMKLKSFDEFSLPVTLTVKTKKQKADAGAWAGVVADRYFAVTTKAIRELDPNHLILGVRFAGENPWEVVEACGKYCDVVSVNHYSKSGNIDKTLLDNYYVKTKKPILNTEYSFSSMENQSGDPNTKGADVTVPTQKDRVEHLERYARQCLECPYLVGLHWFEWADESPQGRFDGEDQNYGLVDIHDQEYTLLTQTHTKLNQEADSLHGKSKIQLPKEFIAAAEAKYRQAEAGAKVPETRKFLDTEASAQIFPWADNPAGGKMIGVIADGALSLEFESGTGWGCGASIPSNVAPFVAPNVADVKGYNIIQFKAFVPKGIQFMVYVAESGNGDPGGTNFPGVNGADGEAYSFPGFTGDGQWTTYRVDIADLERRIYWGNQKGNNILDLQALADVEFYISGKQGAGKMLVKDLEFRTK